MPAPDPYVFVSHKHSDAAIATVISNFISKASAGAVKVHNSSNPNFEGPRIGKNLNNELKKALAQAQVVILIFTSEGEDWQYCMWECGVATDPRDETPETKIAVFQVTQDSSRVFHDQVVFKNDAEDILKFVTQFHRNEGFVVTGEIFAPDVPEATLKRRATDLHNDLRKVAPQGVREERYRWDRFTLRIDPDAIKRIEKETGDKRIKLITEEAKVQDAFGEALLHFGYTSEVRNKSLKDLVERWKAGVGAKAPTGWIDELSKEMNRAIDAQPADPPSELMASNRVKNWWFYPVVNHAVVMPDGSFEFNIYLYRLPETFVKRLQEVGPTPPQD